MTKLVTVPLSPPKGQLTLPKAVRELLGVGSKGGSGRRLKPIAGFQARSYSPSCVIAGLSLV